MLYVNLLKESIRSGTIASIVIMPVGYAFKYLGLRVGHYGPKLAETLFGNTSELLLMTQHFIIGWLSAIPLLLVLVVVGKRGSSTLVGAIYGVAYYVVINSLALPVLFGELTPWQLGFSFIYPSLIGHIIYGASIGYTAQTFIENSCLARHASVAR